MNPHIAEAAPSSVPTGETEPATSAAQDSLSLAVDFMVQTLEAGGDFAELLQKELRLALGDAVRIIVLSRVMIYLVVAAWLGLSVFLSWVVYAALSYGPWSALVFFALQVVGLLLIRSVVGRLSQSLTLPHTRAQLRAFLGTTDDESKSTSQ